MPIPGPIIIVCTANICRSPMAEGLLAHALAGLEEPLKNLPVASAGVTARSGDVVSANSVAAMKKVGIDISKHRARPLTQEMLDEASAVFCMTESHRTIIRLQAVPVPPELHLLRDFLPGTATREIADPFGGPLKLYEASRDEMVEAIPSLLAFLRKRFAPRPS
ncbi:MAG: low molecular weight protein arginine phosphatase [Candidatus Didemnitutus sp.]|nr:low molecular weight protein arginine phosphatase [Candidatus Didemnitutus sp.]